MLRYEIRVLKDAAGPSLTMRGIYLNDDSALRAAARMADGRPVELWRGQGCIYRSQGKLVPPPNA